MATELVQRLSRIRRTIRIRLAVYGVCALGAGAIGAFLGIVLLDWLVSLPPLLRAAASTCFACAFIAAAYHWVIKPLREPLTLDAIASRIENHFRGLEDRLLSTLSFLEQEDVRGTLNSSSSTESEPPGESGSTAGDGTSLDMMRKAVVNTDEIVTHVPMESALSLRPLVTRCLQLTLGVVVLVAVALLAPGWASIGVARYVHPFGSFEWPRNTMIVPLTGDLKVAVGESVTVRMGVQRGYRETLRGLVHLRESDGSTETVAMQHDGDGQYVATIDAVTADMTYWFEAGDDNTGKRQSRITVVFRPEVTEARATVEPPEYAAARGVRVHDLSEGAVPAPVGGYVTVTIRTSKTVAEDESGAGLRTDEDELIPLTPVPGAPRQLEARFAVTGDLHFRPELRDSDGFQNRGALRYSILATEDGAPTVTVVEPRGVTELTPAGSVPLLLHAGDDFGITQLRLTYQRPDDPAPLPIPLTDRMTKVHGENGVEAEVNYVWNIEELSLLPGDALVYRAEAVDNRGGGENGQIGRSAPMRIRIISDLEFDTRTRDTLMRIGKRLRRTALDQADLMDSTRALVERDQANSALSQVQRDSVAKLAGQENRIARRLRDVARQLSTLANRMERNDTGSDRSHTRVASLAEVLKQTSAESIAKAGHELERAVQRDDVTSQQGHLKTAHAMQEAGLEELHELIKSMSQWGDFQGAVAQARTLLDRQRSVRTRTARIGKAMLGKSAEALGPAEASFLKRTHREQNQLVDDAQQLLSRMKRMLPVLVEQDPSGAESVEAALRTARSHSLIKRMQAAAKAVKDNRALAATIEQKGAVDALRKLVASLEGRERRELARLRKQLERNEEEVARLIEQQEDIRDATTEAGSVDADEEAWGALETQQRQLKRNTRALGDELTETERADLVGRVVSRAATPMGEAEIELRRQEHEPATAAQEEALELLRDALVRIEALAEEAAVEEMQRSLDQIREHLGAILAAQEEVNENIGKLKDAVETRGRVGRVEAREAARLARQQASARSMVNAVFPDLRQVVVYAWAMQRVAGWMDESRTQLDKRYIDDKLLTTTDRITRELRKLIDAIEETQAMPPNTEFVEAEGAGGGDGGDARGVATKPIPTIAELLVLRAMQIDINERTTSYDADLSTEDVTEAQLRDLTILGEDQAEVQRLTEMVTRRAQHP